jgi:hypothetical protein
VGGGVILVAECAILFALFAAAAGTTLLVQHRAAELEDSILEVVEGAYAWHLVGVKAAEEGVERLLVQAVYPDLDGGDVAFEHEEPRTEHIHWGTGGRTVGGVVEARQDRMGCR